MNTEGFPVNYSPQPGPALYSQHVNLWLARLQCMYVKLELNTTVREVSKRRRKNPVFLIRRFKNKFCIYIYFFFTVFDLICKCVHFGTSKIFTATISKVCYCKSTDSTDIERNHSVYSKNAAPCHMCCSTVQEPSTLFTVILSMSLEHSLN